MSVGKYIWVGDGCELLFYSGCSGVTIPQFSRRAFGVEEDEILSETAYWPEGCGSRWPAFA